MEHTRNASNHVLETYIAPEGRPKNWWVLLEASPGRIVVRLYGNRRSVPLVEQSPPLPLKRDAARGRVHENLPSTWEGPW